MSIETATILTVGFPVALPLASLGWGFDQAVAGDTAAASDAASPQATSPQATSPRATSPRATSPRATSPRATTQVASRSQAGLASNAARLAAQTEDVVRGLSEPSEKAVMLGRLAKSRESEALWHEALDTAQQLPDDFLREQTYLRIASLHPPDEVWTRLFIAASVERSAHTLRKLTELSPPTSVLGVARAMGIQMANRYGYIDLLIALAKQETTLTERSLWYNVLRSSGYRESLFERMQVRNALVEANPPLEVWKRLIAQSETMDDADRSGTLSAVARGQLPQPLHAELLRAAARVKDPLYRAKLYAALGQHLDPRFFDEAVKNIVNVSDLDERSTVLVRLASQSLPLDVRPQVLRGLRETPVLESRVAAAHVGNASDWMRAIEAIEHEQTYTRNHALMRLVEKQPPAAQWQPLIDLARTFDDYEQAEFITAMVNHAESDAHWDALATLASSLDEFPQQSLAKKLSARKAVPPRFWSALAK